MRKKAERNIEDVKLYVCVGEFYLALI